MLIDNLADPQAPVEEIKTRLDTVETQAPMGYSSVTDGQIRIASPEGLWVEGEGGIKLDGRMDAEGVISITGLLNLLAGSVFNLEGTGNVTGSFNLLADSLFRLDGTGNVTGTFNLLNNSTLNVDGTLNGDGQITWDGNAHFKGPFETSLGGVKLGGPVEIAGPTKVNSTFETTNNTKLGGTVEIAGTTTINGNTTVNSQFWTKGQLVVEGKAILYNELEVIGTITNGPITIGNSQITIGGGSGISISSGGINANFFRAQTQLIVAGGMTVSVDGLGAATNLDQIGHWLGVGAGGQVMTVAKDIGGPMGGDLIWIFDPATINDGFGPREPPPGGGSSYHRGVDWPIAAGTPIPAAGNGTVIFAGGDPAVGFGYHVEIRHDARTVTRYAHFQASPPVSVGDRVSQKQIIGACGSTGTSTGPHLHFEVLVDDVQIDPEGYITAPWMPF